MIALSKEAGAAMATAVRRANKKSVAQLVAELEQAHLTIERLRDQLRRHQDQRQQSALLDSAGSGAWSGETHAGRPVLTLSEAARRAHKHYQAAYRRVQSGKWQAVQLASGDWRVYADQPLT